MVNFYLTDFKFLTTVMLRTLKGISANRDDENVQNNLEINFLMIFVLIGQRAFHVLRLSSFLYFFSFEGYYEKCDVTINWLCSGSEFCLIMVNS